MKKRRILLAGATCLVALVAVSFWLSRPTIPFQFLEGATLEDECLLSELDTVSGSLTDSDTLVRRYTLSGSWETVREGVKKELLERGWYVKVESVGTYGFESRTSPIKFVLISRLSEGLVDVDLHSDASLSDKIRSRIGLRKRAPEGQGSLRIRG